METGMITLCNDLLGNDTIDFKLTPKSLLIKENLKCIITH